ncbi:hypothetical protein [Nocardioides sp. GXZ039]|uniref:hypothetical protein n=1 Tax=Nocardioides sp. GXZ039 TaxID=3136018 RepID=UPI0030F434A5
MTTSTSSKAGITQAEMLQSLTGYEEIAIERAFGFDVYTGDHSIVAETRAFVFVHKKREGMTDADAKKSVLEMSFKETRDYFDKPEPELDPDNPETESGKDSEPSE